MIKMLVFDLDNTLLDDSGKIDDYTVNTLNQIKIKKVIATSRCLNNANAISKTIGGTSIVFSKGAGIMDEEDITYNYLKWDDVRDLIKELLLVDNNLKITIKTNDKYYSNFYDSLFIKVDFNNFKSKKIEKITIDGLNTSKLSRIMNKYHLIDYTYLRDNKIIITSINANKVAGVKYLLEKYQIKDDEIIVFGDDLSDMLLFKTFKNTVQLQTLLMKLKNVLKIFVCLIMILVLQSGYRKTF